MTGRPPGVPLARGLSPEEVAEVREEIVQLAQIAMFESVEGNESENVVRLCSALAGIGNRLERLSRRLSPEGKR